MENILSRHFPVYHPVNAEDIFQRGKNDCAIILFSMDPVAVSITEGRENVRQGKPIGKMVAAAVVAYIAMQGLYRGNRV